MRNVVKIDDLEAMRRRFYAQTLWIAKANTAHIDFMTDQLHSDEEWAIDQILHSGSLSPEISTHAVNYEPQADL